MMMDRAVRNMSRRLYATVSAGLPIERLENVLVDIAGGLTPDVGDAREG